MQILTHTHNGILFSHKKKETLPFLTIWMDPEDIMLSEISLSETNTLLSNLYVIYFKRELIALVGWLNWLEHHPIHQKIAGLIPSQETYLGCVFDPMSGHIWEATNRCFCHINVSLSLSLSLSLSTISKNQ